MPTYEYRCEKCGENFDMIQSFSARPLRRHQGCGGEVEKVFHPRGVVFKGSGFYVTDSRPKSSSSDESSNGDSSETPKKSAEPATPPPSASAAAAAD